MCTWSADYFLRGGEGTRKSQGCAANCKRSHTQAAAINFKCLHTYEPTYRYTYVSTYTQTYTYIRTYLPFVELTTAALVGAVWWKRRNALSISCATAVAILIHTRAHIQTYAFSCSNMYLLICRHTLYSELHKHVFLRMNRFGVWLKLHNTMTRVDTHKHTNTHSHKYACICARVHMCVCLYGKMRT